MRRPRRGQARHRGFRARAGYPGGGHGAADYRCATGEFEPGASAEILVSESASVVVGEQVAGYSRLPLSAEQNQVAEVGDC